MIDAYGISLLQITLFYVTKDFYLFCSIAECLDATGILCSPAMTFRNKVFGYLHKADMVHF
jgi:hypothetical protein